MELKNELVQLYLPYKCDDFFYKRGKVYKKYEMYSEALLDFDKAIEEDNNDYNKYYDRADTKERLRLYNEAVDDYYD